jgi:hypothetical protein
MIALICPSWISRKMSFIRMRPAPIAAPWAKRPSGQKPGREDDQAGRGHDHEKVPDGFRGRRRQEGQRGVDHGAKRGVFELVMLVRRPIQRFAMEQPIAGGVIDGEIDHIPADAQAEQEGRGQGDDGGGPDKRAAAGGHFSPKATRRRRACQRPFSGSSVHTEFR